MTFIDAPEHVIISDSLRPLLPDGLLQRTPVSNSNDISASLSSDTDISIDGDLISFEVSTGSWSSELVSVSPNVVHVMSQPLESWRLFTLMLDDVVLCEYSMQDYNVGIRLTNEKKHYKITIQATTKQEDGHE